MWALWVVWVWSQCLFSYIYTFGVTKSVSDVATSGYPSIFVCMFFWLILCFPYSCPWPFPCTCFSVVGVSSFGGFLLVEYYWRRSLCFLSSYSERRPSDSCIVATTCSTYLSALLTFHHFYFSLLMLLIMVMILVFLLLLFLLFGVWFFAQNVCSMGRLVWYWLQSIPIFCNQPGTYIIVIVV